MEERTATRTGKQLVRCCQRAAAAAAAAGVRHTEGEKFTGDKGDPRRESDSPKQNAADKGDPGWS
ncbi:hypothetical protein INR49_013813 [Caranx melampygus]|nr:hypothetical protein INR49_013813 [Caranx melampygus]